MAEQRKPHNMTTDFIDILLKTEKLSPDEIERKRNFTILNNYFINTLNFRPMRIDEITGIEQCVYKDMFMKMFTQSTAWKFNSNSVITLSGYTWENSCVTAELFTDNNYDITVKVELHYCTFRDCKRLLHEHKYTNL